MHAKREEEELEDGKEEFKLGAISHSSRHDYDAKSRSVQDVHPTVRAHSRPENVFPTFLVFGCITVYY